MKRSALLIRCCLLLSLLAWVGKWGCKGHLASLGISGAWKRALPPLRDPKAQFADLHTHPFRSSRSCLLEHQICDLPLGPTFANRATFGAIRNSGLSLIVASFVKLKHGGLGLRSMRRPVSAQSPTSRALALKFDAQQHMRFELLFAKWRISIENQFVRHCQGKATPARRDFLKRMAALCSAAGGPGHWRTKALASHRNDRDPQAKALLQAFPLPKPRRRDFAKRASATYRRLWKLKANSYRLMCRYIKHMVGRCGRGIKGKTIAIVEDPRAASQAIARGQIAMVLGLEQLGFLQDPHDVAFFYDLGIRLSTLVHLSDNCLSGSADLPWSRDAVRLIQKAAYGPGSNKACVSRLHGPRSTTAPPGLQCLEGWNANQGLTTRGVSVVRSMIRKGMMIDLAHLSQTSTQQLLSCIKARPGYPPLLYSHVNFRDGSCGRQGEYGLSKSQLRRIHQLKGMVGFGFHQDALDWMQRDRHLATQPLTPLKGRYPGTPRDRQLLQILLENVAYLERYGRHVAFGLDYNGGISPPVAFPSLGHLRRLTRLFQRERPKIYRSLAASAPRFIALWKRAQAASRWWKGKTGPIPLCPNKNFHQACPWHPSRRTCR